MWLLCRDPTGPAHFLPKEKQLPSQKCSDKASGDCGLRRPHSPGKGGSLEEQRSTCQCQTYRTCGRSLLLQEDNNRAESKEAKNCSDPNSQELDTLRKIESQRTKQQLHCNLNACSCSRTQLHSVLHVHTMQT